MSDQWLTSGGRYGNLEYDEDLNRVTIVGHEPHHSSTRLSVPLDVLIDFLVNNNLIEQAEDVRHK